MVGAGDGVVERLAGMMARTNPRQVPLVDFTGEITFYSDYGKRDSNGWGEGWLEFKARIERGRLVQVELLEDRVPADVLAQESAQELDAGTGLPAGSETARSKGRRL